MPFLLLRAATYVLNETAIGFQIPEELCNDSLKVEHVEGTRFFRTVPFSFLSKVAQYAINTAIQARQLKNY